MKLEEADGGPPAEAHVEYPSPRQGWAMVAMLFAIYIVSQLDRSIFNLLGEHIRRDIGLSDLQLSYLLGTAFALAYAVGGVPFGWAIDRYSRRRTIWAAVSLWSIGTMSCGLSRGFAQMFAARALIGGGESAMVPANQSVLSDMFPPERLAFPFSIYSIGFAIGMGVSLVIGGLLTVLLPPDGHYTLPLVGQVKGWQAIFVVVGAPGLLAALAIFLLCEPPRHRSAESADTPGFGQYWRHVRRNPRFFFNLHCAGILATLVIQSLFAWTAIFYQRIHGWPIGQVGTWLGVMMVLGPSIGLPLHGLIAGRLLRGGRRDGNLRYIAWTFLIAVPPLVLGYLATDPWAGLLLIGLGQAAMISFIPLMPAGLMAMVPREMRGKGAAVLQLITSGAGWVFGPTIIALISNLLGGPERLGMALALCVGVGLPLSALFYAFTLKPLREGMRS
jgi:MFS family permease